MCGKISTNRVRFSYSFILLHGNVLHDDGGQIGKMKRWFLKTVGYTLFIDLKALEKNIYINAFLEGKNCNYEFGPKKNCCKDN